MTMLTWLSPRVAAACFAALLAGCQTPPAVYALAEKSSGSAGIFQNHLAELAAQERALARQRAEQVAAMDAFNARLDGVLKRELFMQQRSRTPAEWSQIQAQMEALQSLRDELVQIEENAKFAQADRQEQILAAQADLDIFRDALREATNALDALARRESGKDRARFLGQFLRDLRGELKQSLDKNDKASQAAKKLVDDLKAKIKDADTDKQDGANP